MDWPTNLSTGWVALPPTLTFYWTGVTDALGYVVQVKDSNYNLIWEGETLETSINYGEATTLYGGTTPLTSGGTYYLYVIVYGTSYCANGTSYTVQNFIAP